MTYELRGYLTQSDFESGRIFDYLGSAIVLKKEARRQTKYILKNSPYRIVKILSEDEDYTFTEIWQAMISIVKM